MSVFLFQFLFFIFTIYLFYSFFTLQLFVHYATLFIQQKILYDTMQYNWLLLMF